jgi:hypothetical protein
VVTRCLRKRAQDRYADAKELVGELKSVQREVESGISSRTPLSARLQEQWQALRDRPVGEWLLPAALAGAGVVVLALFVLRPFGAFDPPSLIVPAIVALLAWRRFRNRRLRLARRLVGKLRKIPEVRVVALDHLRVTVLADKAQAKTYVRANAALDAVNSSMFFGDPFTLLIRDDATPEEERALLSTTGVLYVREEASGQGR